MKDEIVKFIFLELKSWFLGRRGFRVSLEILWSVWTLEFWMPNPSSILTLSRENFLEFIYLFGEFCLGVHNEADTNVKEENWWGWGDGIKYLRRAQKVTKVWKGRSDGDGSVLGGSRAALIHNDGAALAVRIAIPVYPQVPTSTFQYPFSFQSTSKNFFSHTEALFTMGTAKAAEWWIAWKDFWSAWQGGREGQVRFPNSLDRGSLYLPKHLNLFSSWKWRLTALNAALPLGKSWVQKGEKKMWTMDLGNAEINYFRLIREQWQWLKALFSENADKKDKPELTQHIRERKNHDNLVFKIST